MTTKQSDAEFREDFNLSGEKRPAKAEHPAIDRSRWGLFPDVDIAAYHAGFIEELTLSQSGMGRLLDETPLDYAYNNQQMNPDAEKLKESVAMYRGDIVHQLALGKGEGYAIAPASFGDWRKGEAQAFKKAAIERGETPILAHAFEEAEVLAEVVKGRIEELCEGAPYETEVAFLYQEMTPSGPIWVRGLLDVWCPEKRLILDPKVTPQLYDAKVGRHMVNMGWDRQAALYPHAVGMILGPEYAGRIRFLDVMVKPEAPYTTRTVRLDKADEAQAIKECLMAMELFGRCYWAGRWPGFEGIDTVSLPGWTRKAREEREIAGV